MGEMTAIHRMCGNADSPRNCVHDGPGRRHVDVGDPIPSGDLAHNVCLGHAIKGDAVEVEHDLGEQDDRAREVLRQLG